jgi:ribosome-associated heat shock protein Hsp15
MPGMYEENSDQWAARTQRLDKWLWFSRVSKSRTLAAQLIEDGRVRVNRARVIKPSHAVRAGDVLTIVLRGKVQVLRVLAAGRHRGPPSEARQLYETLGPEQPGAPPQPPASCVVARREPGAGRPRKRDRRMMERFRGTK